MCACVVFTGEVGMTCWLRGWDPGAGGVAARPPFHVFRTNSWAMQWKLWLHRDLGSSAILLLSSWVTLGMFSTFFQPLPCFAEFIEYNNTKLARLIWRYIGNIKPLTEDQTNSKNSININFFLCWLLLIDRRGLLRRFLIPVSRDSSAFLNYWG